MKPIGNSLMVLLTAVLAGGGTSQAEPAYAVYGGQTVTIEKTLADPADLWVTPEDLTRINGFEVKPEGACLGAICIPLSSKGDDAVLVTRDGQRWVNVSALAGLLNQAQASNAEERVWSFGEIPATLGGYLNSAVAPDFALKDRSGKVVRLSDFRGKKVLLVTWASW